MKILDIRAPLLLMTFNQIVADADSQWYYKPYLVDKSPWFHHGAKGCLQMALKQIIKIVDYFS